MPTKKSNGQQTMNRIPPEYQMPQEAQNRGALAPTNGNLPSVPKMGGVVGQVNVDLPAMENLLGMVAIKLTELSLEHTQGCAGSIEVETYLDIYSED